MNLIDLSKYEINQMEYYSLIVGLWLGVVLMKIKEWLFPNEVEIITTSKITNDTISRARDQGNILRKYITYNGGTTYYHYHLIGGRVLIFN